MRVSMMALMMLLPVGVMAHEFTAGSLKIGHPWTRATPVGSENAAGYLTVTNTGKVADVLVSAEVHGVEHVMVHSIRTENGVAHMDDVEGGVAIAPGKTVALQPGGLHLMWMGLEKPLVAGQMVSGTLTLEKAGVVPVEFKVEAAGAKAAAHAH